MVIISYLTLFEIWLYDVANINNNNNTIIINLWTGWANSGGNFGSLSFESGNV